MWTRACALSLSLSLCVWCRMRSVGEHSKDKEDVLCGERGTENLDTLDTRHWICVTVSGNGGEMRSRALQCSSGARTLRAQRTNIYDDRLLCLCGWRDACGVCERERLTWWRRLCMHYVRFLLCDYLLQCRKHSLHKVTQYKKGKDSLYAQGMSFFFSLSLSSTGDANAKMRACVHTDMRWAKYPFHLCGYEIFVIVLVQNALSSVQCTLTSRTLLIVVGHCDDDDAPMCTSLRQTPLRHEAGRLRRTDQARVPQESQDDQEDRAQAAVQCLQEDVAAHN